MAKGAADTEFKRSREKRRPLPPGSPCPNCAAPLHGAWCSSCGQRADDYRRPLATLIAESFKELTDFDGRFMSTIPRLFVRPGQLTREYVQGRRQGQIPPVRMFLVAVVALFLAAGVERRGEDPNAKDAVVATVEGMNQELERRSRMSVSLQKPGAPAIRATGEDAETMVAVIKGFRRTFVLFAPLVVAPLVGLALLGRRRLAFDHLVFSLHSVAFQGLLFSTYLLLAAWRVENAILLLALAPIHLFFHLRGAYGLGVGGALWRSAFVMVGELIGFFGLMLALLVLGYSIALAT